MRDFRGAAVVALGVVAAAICAAEATIESPSLREFFYLGEYYAKTDQPELAVVNYQKMIAKHPATREAELGWLGIGQSYYIMVRNDQAKLDKAKASATATKKELEEIESKIRSDAASAVAAYGSVIAQFPASKAEAVIGVARVLSAQGLEKAEDAVREFRKVIENYPEEAGRAQLLLGDHYASAGDDVEAARAYAAASLSFPEVASLAMMKYADLMASTGETGKALDNYGTVIEAMGIDGAYTDSYHAMGDLVEKAVRKRGEIERAAGNAEEELDGYTAAASRYYGTNVEMAANLDRAGALWYGGKADEAAAMLNAITDRSPRSVWAVKALMKLASLQGDSPAAAATWGRIIQGYPQSVYWVDAQLALAGTCVKLAAAAEEADAKTKLKADALAATEAVASRYPSCPEAERVATFRAANKL